MVRGVFARNYDTYGRKLIMNLSENKKYIEDIKKVAELPYDWSYFKDKSIMITGATGMIFSLFTDVLMFKNLHDGLNCKIYPVSRSLKKLEERFPDHIKSNLFIPVIADIGTDFSLTDKISVDYFIHGASNTHPLAYSTDPIGTITTNIVVLEKLLSTLSSRNIKRFVFLSSVEIYGENRGDTDKFSEDYCGYIDCNTMRAGYPESKRCGEALCQAYIKQKNMDIVIPRLSRVYGPTMLPTDTKAISQFIKNGVSKNDIVLKSKGEQLYSYSYAADAVSGVFYVMIYGKNGEAYNICEPSSDITLKDLAGLIAEHAGTKVIFDLPDATEKAGYSTATKATLDPSKLLSIGWKPMFPIKDALPRTIDILEENK